MDHPDVDIALPEPRSNRPVTIAHRIEYAAAITLGAFFRLIGVDASSALAGRFLRLVGPMIGPINKRAMTNLSIAFPEMPEDGKRAIIADVWENLGRTTAEFAHLGAFDPDADASRVEIVGREVFETVIQSKRPAIFFSGHFANWEVMAVVMRAVGLDFGIIYRAANNPLIDRVIINSRADASSRRQIPKGKRGGRTIIEALEKGSSIVLLADQKLNSGGIPSPLFGKPAMTAPASARLALKYNMPVIPLEVERLNGARFRVTARVPLDFQPGGDTTADTQALTDRINLELERMIRAQPGQWLWLHRRWAKEEYK